MQTTGAGAVAPIDLELGLECAYIYDNLIMTITKEKSNMKIDYNSGFKKYALRSIAVTHRLAEKKKIIYY